tara:strand:- start:1325 stop:1474 length:150 start_codon:yes stop_codon:yes gene_type:complete
MSVERKPSSRSDDEDDVDDVDEGGRPSGPQAMHRSNCGSKRVEGEVSAV